MARETPEMTITVRRWRWLLWSDEPWPIKDMEVMDRQSFTDVMARCHQQVARASYMPNQPNREVYWRIEEWDKQRQKFMEICNGRSRVKDRPMGLPPASIG